MERRRDETAEKCDGDGERERVRDNQRASEQAWCAQVIRPLCARSGREKERKAKRKGGRSSANRGVSGVKHITAAGRGKKEERRGSERRNV